MLRRIATLQETAHLLEARAAQASSADRAVRPPPAAYSPVTVRC
jgi:hypothetical protein